MVRIKISKKIRAAFFLAVLLIGLGAGISLVKKEQDLRSRAQTANVNLFISPDALNTSFLEEFSLDVFIDTNTSMVSAVKLEISYDINFLEGVSIEVGEFLPVVLTDGIIADGIALITLGSNPEEPKDGIGIIATLTFRAKEEAGNTQIQISGETEVAAIQQTGNVAGTLSPADISVGTLATITDTQTSPTSSPPPGIAGDINNDGVVNILDFQILSNNFGTNDIESDLNQDGVVNILDFQILNNNFGNTSG